MNRDGHVSSSHVRRAHAVHRVACHQSSAAGQIDADVHHAIVQFLRDLLAAGDAAKAMNLGESAAQSLRVETDYLDKSLARSRDHAKRASSRNYSVT